MENQSESTLTSYNVNEAPNKDSSKLIDREPIEGTPFTMITMPNKAFIAMGAIRISPEFTETTNSTPKYDAEMWLQNNTINAIATMCGIIAEHVFKEELKIATDILKEKATHNSL